MKIRQKDNDEGAHTLELGPNVEVDTAVQLYCNTAMPLSASRGCMQRIQTGIPFESMHATNIEPKNPRNRGRCSSDPPSDHYSAVRAYDAWKKADKSEKFAYSHYLALTTLRQIDAGREDLRRTLADAGLTAPA